MADNLIRTKQINQADLSGAVQNVIESNEFQLTYGGTGINVNNVGQITISGTDIYLIDSSFNVSGTGVFTALDLNNIDTLNLSGVSINIDGADVNLGGNLSVSGDVTVGGTLRFNQMIDTTVTGVISGYTGLFYTVIANTISGNNIISNNLVYLTGNQVISGTKTFDSFKISQSGKEYDIGNGLNINSKSGIVRINTNLSSSYGAGFQYALNDYVDPNRPLDIEGRARLVHGLQLDAGSNYFTSASDHFHFIFSAAPNNPGSANGQYGTNYKSYQFSPTTRPNGNDNQRDLIHLTTLESKGANDEIFPTSALTELYLTTTGTVVVTPPGTGLVELAYAINGQATSQYLHATGDTVYLRVNPGVAGLVANTYNGTVVRRITGYDPGYGTTNVYKVGINLGALGFNNNFNASYKGTSTQTDAWALSRNTTSSAFTGIKRIERNTSQYLDQFNVFYTAPITGYTGESVVVDVYNRITGSGIFVTSGINLTQGRYDGYVSRVLSLTGLEITLSTMNYGSLGGIGRPGNFHNGPLTTGTGIISSEDLVSGMQIYRGASDTVHRNYWAHNVFVGFRNVDANELNVPAGVITRVAVGGLNRVESGSSSALGYNNKAYNFNAHAYGANQENYNRDSVRVGATTGSYINIVSGKVGVNVNNPFAVLDLGTGNILAGDTLVSGGILTVNNINPVNNYSLIVKNGGGANGLTFNPAQEGGAGHLSMYWMSTIGIYSKDDNDIILFYGGSNQTKGVKFRNYAGVDIDRILLDRYGNFGIGSGISAVPNDARLYVSGNTILQGNVNVSGTGVFSNVRYTSLPFNPLSVVGSGNTYIQANIQNLASGDAASADLVITSNAGTDTVNYLDLGINNSGYNQAEYNIGSSGDGYLYIHGGNLTIGTQTTGKTIKFHVNGTSARNQVAEINASGIVISGNLAATSKSFLIPHPLNNNKQLQYASLEGPEHGVFVRGKTNENIINLPNYWSALVHENSISVNLTPISAVNNIYVVEYDNKRVITAGNNSNDYFYTIYGERKDIPKLTVEY